MSIADEIIEAIAYVRSTGNEPYNIRVSTEVMQELWDEMTARCPIPASPAGRPTINGVEIEPCGIVSADLKFVVVM